MMGWIELHVFSTSNLSFEIKKMYTDGNIPSINDLMVSHRFPASNMKAHDNLISDHDPFLFEERSVYI